MEIEYELTLDDLYAFQWRAAYTSPIARRARLKVHLYLFLTLLLLSSLLASMNGLLLLNYIFIATSFVILNLMTWWLHRRLTRRAILQLLKEERPNRGQLGRHNLRLSEVGLVETTEVGESRCSWMGVDRVEESDDFVFIYTAPHAAHVVPKRAFGTPHEAETFYDFARACQERCGVTVACTRDLLP